MSSRNDSRIEFEEMEGLAGVQRSEPGGRAQLQAGARGRAAGLSQGLVDEAVGRARLRRDLPDEARDRLSDELIDELLAGRRGEVEIVGPGGLLGDLTRRLVERAMAGELTDHLGYEPHHEPPGGTGNARNGSTPKTLQDRPWAGPDRPSARPRRQL